MKNIGEQFKKIRKSKNLSLRYVAEGITTNSFLSKFERGVSGISLDILMLTLQKMNMTTSEFLNYATAVRASYYSMHINSLRSLSISNNVNQLLDEADKEHVLWEKTQDTAHLHLALIAKALYCQHEGTVLKDEEQKTIKDYLFNSEQWYHYDLTLFNYTVGALSIEYQIQMGNELLKKLPNSYFVNEYRDAIIMSIVNVIFGCIEYEYFDVAEKYINDAISYFDNSTYYHVHVIFKFFRGLLELHNGNIDEGFRLANFAINVMNELGNEKTANDYQMFLNDFSNKLNIVK